MRLNKSLVLVASALLLASCNKPTEVKPMPPIYEQGEEKAILGTGLMFKESLGFNTKDASIFDSENERYVIYDANEERKGLYEREISTIDALDDLVSQKQNNIDYFANAYMYIIGGKINEKDAIRMRQQRLINATSANAMNAKIGFLERPNADGMEEHQRSNLLEMIHNNTGIPNMNDEHFAGNSSGVAIKYKCQTMEDKAATKESKFKYALRNFYRIIFAKNTKLAINSEAWEDLKFYFKRNLPANLTDEADIVNKLQGIVSDETLLTILSVVSDPKEELKQREQEQDKKLQNAMNLSKPDALVDDGENNG